jgi:hypothetical protein
MRKILLWSPAILFFGIIATTLMAKLGWLGPNSAHLKMTNRSATEISNISVSLYTTACRIEHLATTQSAVCKLAIGSDSHYSISWTESNASSYQERAGYVTHGLDFNHQLNFLGEGKIDFSVRENH